MARKQMSRKEQLAEVIRESYEQWKRLWENGGKDPFWTDGANLNLVRNHIIYGRRLCEEELQEGDYPEEYYLPIPEKVHQDLMVKSDEIREKVRAVMKGIRECPDYAIAVAAAKKSRKAACIISYTSGYGECILKDDLVAMRRLLYWDFQGMVQEMKKELEIDVPVPVEKIEKHLPEGQLSIFDLFNI